MAPRARLVRIAARASEGMVEGTGRMRDRAHLQANLDYISRNGELTLEDQDGALLCGREGTRRTASVTPLVETLTAYRLT